MATLEFDAAGSNLDGSNPGTALVVSDGTTYGLTAHSFPAPPLVPQWASSADTEGSLLSSARHENRQLSLTIDVMSAAGLRSLEAKASKLIREGGTLKWTLPASSEVVIFDVLTVDRFDPSFDVGYYINTGAYCVVEIALTAKPYGRGPEVDLGDNTETTLPALVFTDTGVKGDWYGLGRLVVDNDSASVQTVMRWGIQSRYYSNASTAALFYQAESCALGGATVATGPATASGGATNNTAFFGTLPQYFTGGSGHLLMYLGGSSTAQTHIGTFRMFARTNAPALNAGTVGLRASWQASVGGPTTNNDWVWTSGGAWDWLDLGQVIIPKANAGTQGWLGWIEGVTTDSGGTDDIYIDWIMLLPVDEGSGEQMPTSSNLDTAAGDSVHIRHDGAYLSKGGYLSRLGNYSGDYLFIPPAGLESRTLRVIVKMALGGFGAPSTNIPDSQIDDISARLFYTPRYLVVPEP